MPWLIRSVLSLLLAPLLAAAAVSVGRAEPPAILLWPGGAPGSEGKTEGERVRLTAQGEHIVSHVNFPSITPYLPDRGKASGLAVIVAPGGGHRELWMDHEGYRVGQWLRDHGVAAFVLKYRLAREDGSTYTVEGSELADLQRAIRVVRSRAAEWNIDPGRIGVMGFSAGGAIAALAGVRYDSGDPGATDPVERNSSKPAFMALIYPAIPRDMQLSSQTPPAFLLCGENDDPAISQGLPELYLALKRSGATAELHVLTGAGHGFGVRASNPPALRDWPSLFYHWLDARGLLAAR
jgi:endo-1,4-beta-xylanase